VVKFIFMPGSSLKKPNPLLDEAEAYSYALRLLGRRPYSTGGLLEKFRLRALPAAIAETVIEKLVAKKFLNDQAYAEALAHFKASQNWGPSKIRTALYQKKVPREIIDQVLKSSHSPEGEAQQALELLERQKQRFLRKKEKEKGQRSKQAFGFLVRKGYSPSAARLAVNRVFGYNSDLSETD
jgi:SOS response regulatory protein OraA/RecX